VRRVWPLLAALGAVAALLLPYWALGGGSFEPEGVADPCVTREWRDPGGLEETLEQIVLSAFDGAACDLGVSREELVLAVRSEDALDAFARQHDIDREDAEAAVQTGLARAVDDAEEAGAISSGFAGVARRVVESVPPWLVLDVLDTVKALVDLG
jgi:hypothetical protein